MTTTLDIVREVETLRTERDHYKQEFERLRIDFALLEGQYRQLKTAWRSEKSKSDHYIVSHTAMREALANATAIVNDAVSRADQAPYTPLPSPHREVEQSPQDLDEVAREVARKQELGQKMLTGLAADLKVSK